MSILWQWQFDSTPEVLQYASRFHAGYNWANVWIAKRAIQASIAIACDLHNLCISNNDATEVEADIKVATGSFDADQDEDDNVPVNIGFVKWDNICAALQW